MGVGPVRGRRRLGSTPKFIQDQAQHQCDFQKDLVLDVPEGEELDAEGNVVEVKEVATEKSCPSGKAEASSGPTLLAPRCWLPVLEA